MRMEKTDGKLRGRREIASLSMFLQGLRSSEDALQDQLCVLSGCSALPKSESHPLLLRTRLTAGSKKRQTGAWEFQGLKLKRCERGGGRVRC